MPIRAILFDLDNTLWSVDASPDWDAITALQSEALAPDIARLGFGALNVREFVRRFWKDYASSFPDPDSHPNPPLVEPRWREGATMIRKTLGTYGGQCSENHAAELWETLNSVHLRCFGVQPYSDAVSTVEALSAIGYRLAIVTGRPLTAKIVGRELRDQGLPGVFEVIVTSGEVGYRKQHPLVLESALARLGVQSDEAIVVGDSYEDDIVPAARMGMTPVLKLNDREPDASWVLARYQVPSLGALLRLEILNG